MCTIVVAWRCLPASWGVDFVLAANRDELRSRDSDPPRLAADPPVWAGRDRLAGGTWLAVDPAGRVAAVTNRHPGGKVPTRDPERVSRGRLPLDLLRGDDDAARACLGALRPASFNPVNAVYLSRDRALVLHLDDQSGATVVPVEPGVHVLGEQDLDDHDDKTSGIRRAATAVVERATDPGSLVAGLQSLLSSHTRYAEGPSSAACIHEAAYGTVSSSVVSVGDDVSYSHAEGPPCTAPFEPVLPWRTDAF